MGNIIPKISLGSSSKKHYTRRADFDNNTTMEFGYIQPLFSKLLEADSNIRVSYKQLVRLAPMPCPTFGRISLDSEIVFVPLGDVVPFYDAMRSQQEYSVGEKIYIPSTLPFTSNSFLLYLLLVWFSEYSLYVPISDSDPQTGGNFICRAVGDSAYSTNFAKYFFGNFYRNLPSNFMLADSQCILADGKYYNSDGSQIYSSDGNVTPDGADFIIEVAKDQYYCFRLTQIGRRLRNTLIGLGYSLNGLDSSHVSFAPLLAFFKAWFDTYGVQRSQNWLTTKCFAIIKYIEDNCYCDFSDTFIKSSVGSTPIDVVAPLIYDFFQFELSQTWYTIPDDFLAIHRSEPDISTTPQFSTVGLDGNKVEGDTSVNLGTGTTNSFTLSTLQVLQRVSRYVNKDSIIGKKLSQWLKVHLNSDISNSLYKNVYHVSSARLPIEINDIFSTSDTAVEDSEGNRNGELLGAYAGKGLGFDKNGFKFHSPVKGFLFMMSAIVPKGGIYQGSDYSLYQLDNDTMPNSDFDAVGYELTPLGAVNDYNNILTYDDSTNGRYDGKSFGYVPRYTMYKVSKNVVNGDMSRRGCMDDFSPYYLDRIILRHRLLAESKGQNTYLFSFDTGNVPNASEQWRYITRYPWIGNYNRIFYNDSGLPARMPNLAGDYALVDDHFIVQTLFDVSITDFLKPVSQSFDTYDESSDTSTVDVAAE